MLEDVKEVVRALWLLLLFGDFDICASVFYVMCGELICFERPSKLQCSDPKMWFLEFTKKLEKSQLCIFTKWVSFGACVWKLCCSICGVCHKLPPLYKMSHELLVGFCGVENIPGFIRLIEKVCCEMWWFWKAVLDWVCL